MSERSQPNSSSSYDSQAESYDLAFLSKYQGNPVYFGNPDGARADLRDFVELNEVHSQGLRKPGTASTRVVIGPKGSGKTLYLRRLATVFRENPSMVIADARQLIIHESPPTRLLTSEHVIKIGTMFPGDSLTEVWQLLWGRAIVAAAAAHLIFNREMHAAVPSAERESLLKDFSYCLGKRLAAPRSPLTSLKAIVDRFDKAQGLTRFLNDPSWDDLEERVTGLIAVCPPLVFVIDSVDDDFGHAPNYWARCQKGLFYETMRLLRSRGIGARLLVLISLRDIVYHSVFRSEHASRYVGDPHLRLLEWSLSTAKMLLDEKTRKIPEYLFEGEHPRLFKEWIGFESVMNSYGQTESIYQYALRHTQCLPRDIVNMGNLLGIAYDKARSQGISLTPQVFRRVISDVATLSGHVQIGVAANQVIADEIPAEAARHGFISSYLSVDEYRADRIDTLKAIVNNVGCLRFGRKEFRTLQEAGRDEFGAPDLASVLWQCGLLGYTQPEEDACVFFSLDRLGRLRIPADKHEYVLHSSMHEVAHVKIGERPVVPWGFNRL